MGGTYSKEPIEVEQEVEPDQVETKVESTDPLDPNEEHLETNYAYMDTQFLTWWV